MCGIYGVIQPSVESISPGRRYDELRYLADLNAERGDRAFGAYIGQYGLRTNAMLHQLGSTTPELIAHLTAMSSGRTVLCHSLAPTEPSKELLIDHVHPFHTERFRFAHNGLLLDWFPLIGWALRPGDPMIDSLAMIRLIQARVDDGFEVEDAIRLAATACDGQQACWLVDTTDGTIYFWRVMSPLYTWVTSPLALPISSAKPDVREATLLDEGVIYKSVLVNSVPRLDPVASFDYKTPYLL